MCVAGPGTALSTIITYMMTASPFLHCHCRARTVIRKIAYQKNQVGLEMPTKLPETMKCEVHRRTGSYRTGFVTHLLGCETLASRRHG